MVKETQIDKKTKEMIYMAVSITNNCSYCTHSHTASAKKLGMTLEEHSEFLSIVGLAAKTNQIVNGLQVPIDEVFDEDAK
jgi:AhpD family alkylhydroperoxidase